MIIDILVCFLLVIFNWYGLIVGVMGFGKMKIFQIIVEQFFLVGVFSLLMDIKGDFSGIVQLLLGYCKIDECYVVIGIFFEVVGSLVEFFFILEEKGVCFCVMVLEFGLVLFFKILVFNDMQVGIVVVVFKYVDDNELLLFDLMDFKKMLQYMINEGKDEVQEIYGCIFSVSVGVIMCKIVEFEQ